MKPGKLWTPVLKRSVHNILNYNSSKSAARLRVGEDAADFLTEGLTAVAVREGRNPVLAHYAVHNAVNNVLSEYGIPASVVLSLHLRKDEDEQVLKQWIRNADSACRSLSLNIIGGHTSVSACSSTSYLSVTALGKRRALPEKRADGGKGCYEGFHIIMTKYAGLEGTAVLLDTHYNDLKKRYTSSFLDTINTHFNQSGIQKELEIISEYIESAGSDGRRKPIVPVLHDVSEGGIMGALWELSEYLSCGLEIELKKLMFRQLTIEVCEFLDVNPYWLRTCGSLLVVTDEAEELLERFHGQGIPAVDIGRITGKKERILVNQDEIKFLEPFRGDSIYAADDQHF